MIGSERGSLADAHWSLVHHDARDSRNSLNMNTNKRPVLQRTAAPMSDSVAGYCIVTFCPNEIIHDE